MAPELVQTDWDMMILHYLGLDHIGHLAGPNSPLVQPKLNEMDKIVELIYKTAVRQDLERNISTLIVLCGDHGMSDGGSHGGSSSAETTTPLVFMSSLYQRQGRYQFYCIRLFHCYLLITLKFDNILPYTPRKNGSAVCCFLLMCVNSVVFAQ